MGPFHVHLPGETVSLPDRIYHDELDAEAVRALTETQQTILHCLYSRHHDGWVRQRHLEQIVESSEPWVVPFVVQLAGEYVVEILEVILQGISGLDFPDTPQGRQYGEFIARNPSFFARTERRLVSYWSCYYYREYPEFSAYPGSLVVEALRGAASQYAGKRWPRHTPRPLRRL